MRNYDEETHNSSHDSDDSMETPAKHLFAQLDKDGDGYSFRTYDTLLLSYFVTLRKLFCCMFRITFLVSSHRRYLSDVELLPIIGKLHPSERYYAKQQADYIISQVFN